MATECTVWCFMSNSLCRKSKTAADVPRIVLFLCYHKAIKLHLAEQESLVWHGERGGREGGKRKTKREKRGEG